MTVLERFPAQPHLDEAPTIPSHILSEARLTIEERAVFEALYFSDDSTVTNYRLLQAIPHLKYFAHSGFFSIIERTTLKLHPWSQNLGLPDEFSIRTVGGVGLVLGIKEQLLLSRTEMREQYFDHLASDTCREIESDLQDGKLDPEAWQTHQLNGYTFTLTDIDLGPRTNGNRKSRHIVLTQAPDLEHPRAALLTSNPQYQALRILLENNGYIDSVLSIANDGPSNIKNILRQLNTVFAPLLGQDLIDMIPNLTCGYSIDSQFQAKHDFLIDWLGNPVLQTDRLLRRVPPRKIRFKRTEPYIQGTKPEIDNTESRSLRDINSWFSILHIESIREHGGLPESFVTHQGKPFLMVIAKPQFITSQQFEYQTVVIEITEAEAATLALFRDSSTLVLKDIGIHDRKVRQRAKERFRSFMSRLERMDIPIGPWEATRTKLVFPELVLQNKQPE